MKTPTKIFRLVNSSFCAVYQSTLRSINREVANRFIAEVHEFTQSLITSIVHNKLGSEYDFRVDFLLNVYRESKCNKSEKSEIYSNLRDKKNEPLYYVDSGGLQLLRIRLGVLKGSVDEFEKQIPTLLEKQEQLGDILMCLDYIPLWKRGKAIKKSEIVYACYKTISYINTQLDLLKQKKSTSKLLPINQLTQLPPNGLVWYNIIKSELDFSDEYIGGYSLTGFINTGNKATVNSMLYNVAWLTKIQQEIYNTVDRPNLITHILGMVKVPNEYFIYGLVNGNFNHISIDGVTYVQSYMNGYIVDFPFKCQLLNGFGEVFEEKILRIYAVFGDIIYGNTGWTHTQFLKFLRDFHVAKKVYDESRFASYTAKMLFTYYQQIVATLYHIHRLDFIDNKYRSFYNKIKEDPSYFINYFGRTMESIPLVDDQHNMHEVASVEDML